MAVVTTEMILCFFYIYFNIGDINGLLLIYSLDSTCTAIFGSLTIVSKIQVFIIMVRNDIVGVLIFILTAVI